jgi:hypothetical protein
MKLTEFLGKTAFIIALASGSQAHAATCEQWSTNCQLKCAAQDEYGSCINWTQECTQVCVKWQDSSFSSDLIEKQKEIQLQMHLREAAAKFPIGAKSLIWRSGSNGEFIIDKVIQ